MNIASYRRILDAELRPERFGRDRAVLAHLVVHLLLVVTLGVGVALNIAWLPFYVWGPLALLAGHSVGILAFAAHEVGHGAVVRSRWARELFEALGWTFVLFTAATVQRRAHNQLHHLYANTPRDPDRRPTVEEAREFPVVGRLTALIFPNRRYPWFFGLLGFHAAICSYHNNLLWHSVFKLGTRYDTGMTDRQRLRAVLEFVWALGAYGALFATAGFHPAMAAYLWLMYAAATTLDGIYIATNHMLTAQADEHDPVQQTVSLLLPRWVDFLHLSFSHHTEHHLYPTAGPRHYPEIRAALQRRFPEHYHALTLGAALKALFGSPIAVLDAQTLSHLDGQDARPVSFPLLSDDGELVRVVPAAHDDAVAPH